MSSIIYQLNPNDKTLILDTRATLMQGFTAINWTDLRLSMMLSVTKQSDPNDPTGLTETIGAGEDQNQVYIGFKQSDGNLPPVTNFFGISTQKATPDSTNTQLSPENLFVGSYNFDRNGINQNCYAFASNGTTKQASATGSFPLLDSVQPQYATLIVIRMQRTDPTLSLVSALSFATSAGGLPWTGSYYSDTSVPNIRALTATATYSQELGPFTFTSIPDALFVFWPFTLSRLRLSALVLEKYQ